MLDELWTEEQQRAAVAALAAEVAAAGAPEVARRCCYPGILRFMRSSIPVGRQAELMSRFLGPRPAACELGELLARLNCWRPAFDEAAVRAAAHDSIKLVDRAEAAALWQRPVVQPIDRAQPETVRGALHAMVTAMTVGRRGLLGDWAGRPVLDAEAVFQAAVDELLTGSRGFAARCARILLAGGWPVLVEGCGRLVVGRLVP